MKNNIELLAPAGGLTEGIVAINSGADAIYTGLKEFSARKHAKNLTLEELEKLTQYCHLKNKKIFLACNTLLYDEEIEKFLKLLPDLIDIGIDAIIVQDIGLFNILKNMDLNIEIHASTQMNIDSKQGAKIAKKIGFDRVVLARELSLNDIKDISNNSSIDTEVFIHGAMCVCVSGQCNFSSSIGIRSANRGDCAQPCRKPYNLIVDNNFIKNSYILSMKDLNLNYDLDRLIESGVKSFKIEGRMKSHDYVGIISDFYRRIIDHKEITDEKLKQVSDVYSRGFTQGFIIEDKNMTGNPKHIGLCVGKTVLIDKKTYLINSVDLFINDGITYLSDDGPKGIKLTKNYPKNSKIFINDAKIDEDVFRNYSSFIKENMIFPTDFERESISFKIYANIGEPLKLLVSYKNNTFEAISDYIVQEAKSPTDNYLLVGEALSKLGNTFFKLDEITYNIGDNAFIPKSKLNDLRRDFINKILERLNSYKKDISNIKISTLNNKKQSKLRKILLVDKIIDANIYKDFDEIRISSLDADVIRFYQNSGKKVVFKTPNILFNEYDQIKDFIKSNNINSIEVNNIAFIDEDIEKHLGSDIGVFNSYTIDFFYKNNFKSIVLSNEINKSVIRDLFKKSPVELGVNYYINKVVMNTKYMDPDIKRALEEERQVYLEDIKKTRFQIKKFYNNYAIFNSVPQFINEKLKKITADFVIIEYDNKFEAVMNFINNNKEVDFEYTKGHYKRGVQ